VDQAGDEVGRVDLVAGTDDDRFDVLDVGAEPLHERPHRCHDDGGRHVTPRAQPPHRAQAPAHGLDARADPLEGQRLPRREQLDGVGAEVRLEVADQPLGVTGGRDGHHQGPPLGPAGDGGDGEGTGRLGHGEDGVGTAGHGDEGGLVPQEVGEADEGHPTTVPRAPVVRTRRCAPPGGCVVVTGRG
jgi:hypothetical protein